MLLCLRNQLGNLIAVHLEYKRENYAMQEIFSLHIRLEVRLARSIAEDSSSFNMLSIGGLLKNSKGLDHEIIRK